MPVIINDLEIVTDPPASTEEGAAGPGASTSESQSANPPPVSPVVVREIWERESARALRIFAH